MGGTRAYEADETCQEERLEIRHDDGNKTNFHNGGYMQLWQNQKMPNLCPNMWKMISMLLITFPTSHLIKAGFSVVNQFLTKKRNAK